MRCPQCEGQSLEPVLTQNGVEVDRCPLCGGIWLDRGELLLFARNPKRIEEEIGQGWPPKATASSFKSPKTDQIMLSFSILPHKVRLHACPDTHGIWVEGNEIRNLLASKEFFGLDLDRQLSESSSTALALGLGGAVGLKPLPNLVVRSAGVLLGLYAMLILVLMILAEFTSIPVWKVLVLAVAMLGLQFALAPLAMDKMLRWTQQLRWVGLANLPGPLASAIQEICRKEGMDVPYLGIIEDGTPNAFTYGHTPSNARLVMTRGILELLEPDEMEAVVAHEIGHAKHWDIAIMTLAQLVPLIFYYLYRTTLRDSRSNREREAMAQAMGRLMLAWGPWIVYVISQFLVLWLSRTREYLADRFSGWATQNPNALASALVKIAYGMAGEGPSRQETHSARSDTLHGVAALGLFDPKLALSLAIATSVPKARLGHRAGLGGELDPNALKQAMRWDLWNPWAKYYEIQSTHPLVAHRLQHLGEQAILMGQSPLVLFDLKKPESYWDEFALDLLMMWLPVVGGLLGLGLAVALGLSAWWWKLLGAFLVGLAIGEGIRLHFQYPRGHFPQMAIASLIKHVKVSAIRPVPCTVKGTIIGRGVPGLIWSEDFVMQDETGILFLDYEQPSDVWNFYFGLLRGERYLGKSVTVSGWYRRAPVPYLEIWSLTDRTEVRYCYSWVAKIVLAVILCVEGIVLLGM
jgi:Zn-dependent protease with chaperone function